MSSKTSAATASDIFGHPRGLAYLFFAELWERFSFYGMRALLTLYMVEEVYQALANKDTISAIIYSSYGSLVYASPVIGGRLADKILGYRKAVLLGGILMAIGHFTLAIEQNWAFFGGLAFIIAGNGFFKPNISTMVGALYQNEDIRKDSGFTLFYMGINLGAFIAPLICGWLGAVYGWHYGFGLAGVGMVLGVLVFGLGLRSGIFGDKGLAPTQGQGGKDIWIYLGAFLCVPLIAWLLSQYKFITSEESILGKQTLVGLIFSLLGIGILLYLGFILFQEKGSARKKLFTAILFTLFMMLFYGFYELSGGVLTLFAARNVQLDLMNAAQTNSLSPFFIVVLAVPFSLVWAYLHKHRLNPRSPYKFAMGLLMLALGFFLLYFSKNFANAAGMVPFIFLVLMYLLISTGEILTYPIGLSKVTDLSPQRIVSFMMGVWFLSIAFAFQIVGFIGRELSIDRIAEQAGGAGGVATLDLYCQGFLKIGFVSLGGALLALLLGPFMTRWMEKVH